MVIPRGAGMNNMLAWAPDPKMVMSQGLLNPNATVGALRTGKSTEPYREHHWYKTANPQAA